MTKETYYFYSFYNFLGRIAFAKCRDEPIIKSVNGGGKQRIIDKIEITQDQFDNVDLKQLQRIFFPETVKHEH